MKTLETLHFILLLVLLVPASVPVRADEGHADQDLTPERSEARSTAVNEATGREHVAKTDIPDHFGKRQKATPAGLPVWRYTLSLLVVAGVMCGAVWLLKRLQRRLDGYGPERTIRVLARTPLDTRNLIALVRVYDEEMLLGYGPNGASLLKSWAIPGDRTEPPTATTAPAGGPPSVPAGRSDDEP